MLTSEKIDKRYENRKKNEQKVTGLKDKIEERRYQVYRMDLQGFSNNEIADKLGTSLSTIEKDLHYMRYFCIKWYKEVIDGDRTKSFLDVCNQIDLAQAELWKMYRVEKDVNAKKRILDSIVTNSIKKQKGFKGKNILTDDIVECFRKLIGKPD